MREEYRALSIRSIMLRVGVVLGINDVGIRALLDFTEHVE